MKEDLDKRMKEAGMTPLSELLNKNPLGKFSVDTHVKDLKTFEEWLESRHEEMLEMKIRMTLDNKEDDELFEWVISHEAVFNEVKCNLRAAKERSEEELEKANELLLEADDDDFFKEPYHMYDGDHSYNDDDLPGIESPVSTVADGMKVVAQVTLVICILYAIYEVFIQ